MNLQEIAVTLGAVLFVWINFLLVSGLVFRVVDAFSYLSVTGLVVGIGMAWPLKPIFSEFENLDQSLYKFVKENFQELLLTLIVFPVTSFSFIYGYDFPGSNILNLSFHTSSQIFFPIKILYSDLLGEEFASLIFQYGRWYLHIAWLYLLIRLSYRSVSNQFKNG